MSENTTCMPSETWISRVDQYMEIQEKSYAYEKAREEMLSAQQRFEADSRRWLSQLSDIRRRSIASVASAATAAQRAIATAEGNADAAQSEMEALDRVTREAYNSVAATAQSVAANIATAAAMYQRATTQLALSRTMEYYGKFAGEKMRDIEAALTASQQAIGEQAQQAILTNAINDILLMDINVARMKARYEMLHIDAVKLSATVLEHIRHMRQANYAEIGDSTSELIDIDFWSNHRYELVEERVRELTARIERSRYAPEYTIEALQEDIAELRQLDQIEQQLVLEARTAYNHSENRRAQAELCRDILTEQLHYQLVGEGYDLMDRREAYVVRVKRPMSGAQVEIIVTQGQPEGHYNVYFRVNSDSYMDEATMMTLYGTARDIFEESGVPLELSKECQAEYIEPFNAAQVSISDEARRRHGIKRTKHNTDLPH